MPRLPGYDSSRQLTTQRSQALAPKSADASIGGEIARAAGAAANIAAKWGNALNTIQATTAKANYEAGALDIMSRASEDTDYNNSDQYVSELAKLRSDSLTGFSNKANEARVGVDLDFANQAANIKIGDIFKKKTVEAGQVAAYQRIAVAVNNPSPNTDKIVKAYIDEQVAAGIFGAKEGYNLYVDSVAKSRENAFLQDLNTNPAQAQKNLTKNAYGFDVSGKEKAQSLYDKEIKVIRNANEDAIIDMQLEGALDPEYVKQQRKMGFVDANFAKSMVKDLESIKDPVADELEAIRSYNELSSREIILEEKEAWWGNASFEERSQFKADVIESHAIGHLTDKERDTFLAKPNRRFKKDPKVINATKAIKAYSSLYPTKGAKAKAEAMMHKKLMDKIIGGIDPNTALDETIREMTANDLGTAADKDQFGFTIGESRGEYTYIGNNQWQKK